MGRLTDDLLAIFGLKPSDRVSLPVGENKVPASNGSSQPSRESGSVPSYSKTELGEENETKASTEDCFSCKVTGVGALLLATGFVVFFTFKNAKQYRGMKRVAAYGQGISLGTLLTILAGCRAFNQGPFDALNRDKATTEVLKDDLKMFQTLIEKWDQWRTGK